MSYATICSLYIHVRTILGCDTASSVFGIGERLALKKLIFVNEAQFFTKNEDISMDDILTMMRKL